MNSVRLARGRSECEPVRIASRMEHGMASSAVRPPGWPHPGRPAETRLAAGALILRGEEGGSAILRQSLPECLWVARSLCHADHLLIMMEWAYRSLDSRARQGPCPEIGAHLSHGLPAGPAALC
jgi:hypothetical protein